MTWDHVYEGAACRHRPDLDWFPERHAGGHTLAELRAVCASCPVQAECLDMALTDHLEYGVYAGTSERQRRKLRSERWRAEHQGRVAV